jgi:peptidoglycan/LPS O-acetylase OafA/YrhL
LQGKKLTAEGVAVMQTKNRIAQIDGWRGLSILFVIFGHLMAFRLDFLEYEYRSYLSVLATWGVKIFFLISGYVITKMALNEYASNGNFSRRAFYLRRFFRILPAFFVYLAIVACLTEAGLIRHDHYKTLKAAVFICDLPGSDCGWFTGHTWTLAIEEQFYLLFPILFASVIHRPRNTLVMLYILLVSIPFIKYVFGFGEEWQFLSSLAPSFSYICMGALLAAHQEGMRKITEGIYAIYATSVVLVILAALLFLNAKFADLGSGLAYFQTAANNILLPFCFAWLVGSSVFSHGTFVKILCSSTFQFLGTISYSLYLWQQLFLASTVNYSEQNWLLFSPLLLAVAMLSYYFVEKPFMDLGRKSQRRFF